MVLIISVASEIKTIHDLNAASSYKLSPIWRGIKKAYAENLQVWNAFVLNVKFSISWGINTQFWHDWWVGSASLAIPYPILFRLAQKKLCNVVHGLRLYGTNHNNDGSTHRLYW